MCNFKRVLTRLATIFLMIATILPVVILPGCGGKKQTEEGIKKITFLMWGRPEEIKQMERLLEGFRKQNPDVKVECLSFTRGYTEKALTMHAGGTPPDVMMVSTSNTGNLFAYAERGVLKVLDDFVDDELKGKIDSKALECFKWKGRYYAVPRSINPFILYYNRELFDREGLPYPDETWDLVKMIETAKKITKKEGGIITQYGMLVSPEYGFMWSLLYGGKVFNEAGDFVFGKPGDISAIKGMTLLLNAVKEKVAPKPIGEAGFRPGIDLFLTGKIGLCITGSWMCMNLAQGKTKFSWDIAPLPKGEKRVTRLYIVGYGISKDTKYPNASLELVKYLTSAETNKELAYSGREFPASIKAREYYLDDPVYKDIKHKDVIEKSLQYGMLFIKSSKRRQINEIIKQESEKILMEKTSIEEGLRNIYMRVNKILKEK